MVFQFLIDGYGFHSDDDLVSDSGDEYVPKKIQESDFTDIENSSPKLKKAKSKKIKVAKVKCEMKHLDPFDASIFKFTGVTQLKECIEKLQTPANFLSYVRYVCCQCLDFVAKE